MQKHAIEVLKRLENKGYEAYLVGGYVRDLMLGMETSDIDVCTNATPQEVSKIFNVAPPRRESYGTSWIKYRGKVYEITTYREEIKYINNRKPEKIRYINKLEDDVIRRDFTINAICMNSAGEVLDPTNEGLNDLKNKIIRSIGNPMEKLESDALRILRAIRFAMFDDFRIEPDTMEAMLKHRHNLGNVSLNRKKWELDRIFNNVNVGKGIKLIKKFELEKELGINIPNDIVPIPSTLGMYAQMTLEDSFPLTKHEKQTIEEIKTIVKAGCITSETLFGKSLYNALIAADILGVPRKDVQVLYKAMPILDIGDLALNGNEIAKVLNKEPGAYLKDIQRALVKEILTGSLKNHKKPIRLYISKHFNDII